MKKAFKSSTVQDQQVVSKNSIPNPVADIYNQSDKPPPLNILTPYRYDCCCRHARDGSGDRVSRAQHWQCTVPCERPSWVGHMVITLFCTM